MIKAAIAGLMGVAVMVSGTPATAAITTFAQFSAVGNAPNVRWVNNGAASNTAANNTATGSGGYFYTTATGTSRVPANVAVRFQYLQPALFSLGQINANFFMDITVPSGNPATASGPFRIQNVPSGGFSFLSTQAFTVGSVNYGIGTNLLTGTFTSGTIFGSGSSGSFSGNTDDGVLVYTSDVLNFTSTVNRDFSLSITSITPVIFRSNANRALRTFRAVSTGQFSSDPAPLINAIPEPNVWAMLVVGFGLVGVQVRRRARQGLVVA